MPLGNLGSNAICSGPRLPPEFGKLARTITPMRSTVTSSGPSSPPSHRRFPPGWFSAFDAGRAQVERVARRAPDADMDGKSDFQRRAAAQPQTVCRSPRAGKLERGFGAPHRSGS